MFKEVVVGLAFQGYRLTFFGQKQAGPLKQNDWGPSPKLGGLGFSFLRKVKLILAPLPSICFTHS